MSKQTSRTVERITRPGVALMQQLSMTVKLTAMAAILVIPMVLVSLQLIGTYWSERQTTLKEAAGLRLVQKITDLSFLMLDHQGHQHLKLSGDSGADASLAQTRALITSAAQTLGAGIQASSLRELDPNWAPLHESIQAVLADTAPTPDERDAVFRKHANILYDLQKLAALVGEYSGLQFDPHPGSAFLTDIALGRMLPLILTTDNLRNEGSSVLRLYGQLQQYQQAVREAEATGSVPTDPDPGLTIEDLVARGSRMGGQTNSIQNATL